MMMGAGVRGEREPLSESDIIAHQSIGALTFQVSELRGRLFKLEHPAPDDGKGLVVMALVFLLLVLVAKSTKAKDEA